MYRRDFLKLGGLFSAAVLMPLTSLTKAVSFPLEVEAQGKLFRGAPDGKIYISADAGKTWQLHTNFGSHVSIRDLWVDLRGQMQAELGIAGHSFELMLAQTGNGWRTR